MAQRSCSFTSIFILLVLCCTSLSAAAQSPSSNTTDGSEEWGYVEVRKGAHMFWWLYRSPTQTRKEWPLVLWLQGGPGASGVGFGNFEEIGPLTAALLPRQYTWLQKADLLFVDSPVGTGFSYVENKSLLVTKDEDAAIDLVYFLQNFFENHHDLQSSPLFIFAESYGGKYATPLGLALDQAIKSGNVKATLGGVALGDTWISPVDFALSYGSVLKTFARVDDHGEDIINKEAETVQSYVNQGDYNGAFIGFDSLINTVSNLSDNVDVYNLLLGGGGDSQVMGKESVFLNFGNYLQHKRMRESNQTPPDLTSLMNGPIRKKLKIIPDTVIWAEVSGDVYSALEDDFMRDMIPKVDELLSKGINLTIYSGQLDFICATQGTEAWVQKLKWTGIGGFYNATRTPLYCNGSFSTAAFVKAYENLAFYWILDAGHMVPADNPCIALEMVELITTA